ncbi:MAG: RHS repeat-associated core domain-containing protein, partial [Akkermansiaceae bacterium]
TVKVNGKPALTTAQNQYEAWVDVAAGENTLSIEAEDFSPNKNKLTKSWKVNVTGTARTPAYDLNGNTLTDGTGKSYVWDAENRLTKIIYADNSSTEFQYNGLSQRVRVIEKSAANATISDKRYLWAGGNQPTEERDSSGATVLKRYFPQGEQIPAAAAPLDKLFYTKDHLGNIRELTDSNGTLRTRYDYDMWGKRVKLSGTLDTEVGYTGHHHHAKSGLVLTWFRAYDADTGRWLSADPIGEAGGLNLYGYVGNDPTNYWDPLGLETVGGSGCSYRSDPFGHGTKADGTPVDPHIDRITKTGVKYRYDQDGTPRDNAPKIPKKDLRAFTAEQTRLNRTLTNIRPIRPPGGGMGRLGMRMGWGGVLEQTAKDMWENKKAGRPMVPLFDWLSGAKDGRQQQLQNDMLSKPNAFCPRS